MLPVHEPISQHRSTVDCVARPLPRKVAWLVAGFEGYGIRQCVATLTGTLKKFGWDISILSLDTGGTADACEASGLTVVRLGVGQPPQFAGGTLAKPFELVRSARYVRHAAPIVADAIRRVSAEALHVVLPNLVGLAGRASTRAGVPCLWEVPNTIGSRYPMAFNRRMYQWTCQRYRILPLANSRYTADTLGRSRVEPVVFHLGVDAERFSPSNVQAISKADLGIEPESVTFGMLARVTPTKGQDRVLRAIARMKDHQPALHLLVVGGTAPGSTYAEQLVRLAEELGIMDRLHLVGQQADPERYYGAVDIAVNFRVDAEPFGLSVIEAMAMERPVLVHALGGPAETIVDGVTGWHVPNASIEALVSAIERVLVDRPRWRTMGLAGRLRVVEHFSAEVQAKRYIELVERHLRAHVERHS
jgi:glycosyltransferase involved in cell wall biosynthesis